ncbi:transcriptional regulator [Brevibacillus sp. NRS-1366]|uniref:transcriptional regulator n=1 Tax=Brevibacillus sp. NRS-1366 TaxID=3233899 RepID=UPI003D1B3E09
METRVGVIAPQDVVNRILEVGASYGGIQFLQCPYVHQQETLEIVKKHANDCDIFLFGGPIPYDMAKKSQITDKPMVYVPLNGTSLYKIFFKFITENVLDQSTSSLRCSIDTLDRAEVEDCLEELEIPLEKVYINPDQDAEELVQFHYALWLDKKIHAAVTCVTSVYEALKELGVVVHRVTPTKLSIRASLQNVLLEGKTLHHRNTQIAIGILRLKGPFVDDYPHYGTERKRAALQHLLIDFGEEAQAIFEWSERDEVRFITTRGAIEKSTSNFKKVPLLNEIAMKIDIETSLGIGFGHTAHEAGINARQALNKAEFDSRSCYVVDLNGIVCGPLGKGQLQYSLRSENSFRMHLAKATGLSIATINKLCSFYENIENKEITTLDVANSLGLTSRSANRILNVLERSQLATVVGEEQPIHRGRPRQLYRLYLLDEKKDV